MNEESILMSVAKYIGLPENYAVFDPDLIMLVNSELSTLAQIGVVPDEGFKITGPDETWDQILGDTSNVEFIKEFVYIRVRLTFDPPTNSHVYDALKEKSNEIAFRILVATDKPES